MRKKILLIRFSSIGDIVLTSPIIRVLSKELDTELHFLCKKSFSDLVKSNPYLHTVWEWENEKESELIANLKSENFDLVVDLHKNLRTIKVKRALGVPSYSFDKLNKQKWLMVNFKWNLLPKKHIVDRYFEGLKDLDIKNDKLGLDFFIDQKTKSIDQILPEELGKGPYICLVLGAAHFTKQIPLNKLVEICDLLDYPIVLLGGKSEAELSNNLVKASNATITNLASKCSIHESAQCIKHASCVITPDTGMMHISAGLKKPIVAIWGNTIPAFGMFPYHPQKENLSRNIEVQGLPCRPCSKIGKNECPKKHFKCMQEISASEVVEQVNALIAPLF